MIEFEPDFRHFVGGQFISGRAEINVLNPATEQPIGAVPDADAGLVDEAVRSARTAQPVWARIPAQERARYLREIAQGLRAQMSRLARITSLEQGKVLPLAELEVMLAAEYLDYTAEWARRIEGEVITSDRQDENIFIFRRPMGVVAGILPWNFPLFMIARKTAPALVTGNAIVIKPSEETPYGAHAFAGIVAESGLPAGVFNLVCGRGETTGEALVGHPGVNMISFTGSSEVGARIMERAARNITKVSLELGGKAPAIVMDDADLDLAVNAIRQSKVLNSGQACNCVERVYVHRRVAEEFIDRLTRAMASIRYGNPLGQDAVEMGPLINQSAVDRLSRMVRDASERGGQVLVGGNAGDRGGGFHYNPTVVLGTSRDMRILQQEIFGPVVTVDIVGDLDEAIARANDSDYGLTSSIFTRSLKNAMKAIAELQYGETYVNRENLEALQGFHAGTRKSGIGGSDGKHGLYEYMRTQVAYIQC